MKVTYILTVCFFIASVALAVTNNATQSKAQDDVTAPEQDDDTTELSKFMRRKLSASNAILEGLMTNDLTKVDSGAGKLLKMSHAEQWRASTDMMYMHHSREFSRSVETMQKKAQKDSIDGAALAWVDVTMSCIRCHEWVRDSRLVAASPASGVNESRIVSDPPDLIGGGR